MNLKQMLNGDATQLLTAKDYRVASQMRIHAGKTLLGLTPLVAIGAFTNLPILMIPAFYIPTALLIPQINYFLLKSVPQTGKKSRFSAFLGSKKAWIGILLLSVPGYFILSATVFPHFSHYQRHHGFSALEYHTQMADGGTFIVAGLLMTGVCAWLSWTLMKGRRTQSMQRIAAHLAAQEAENA